MDIDKMDKKELIDKISDEIISKLKKTSSSDNLSFKSDLDNKNIQGSLQVVRYKSTRLLILHLILTILY